MRENRKAGDSMEDQVNRHPKMKDDPKCGPIRIMLTNEAQRNATRHGRETPDINDLYNAAIGIIYSQVAATPPEAAALRDERLLEDFQQAMAQWRMYADDSGEERDINVDTDMEAQIYRRCSATLESLRRRFWSAPPSGEQHGNREAEEK